MPRRTTVYTRLHAHEHVRIHGTSQERLVTNLWPESSNNNDNHNIDHDDDDDDNQQQQQS